MGTLFFVVKFVLLFALMSFVLRFILRGIAGNAICLLVYRSTYKDFDSRRRMVEEERYGSPASALLISIFSIKAAGWLHFSHIGGVVFLSLLLLTAIVSYADEVVFNMARSFGGFCVELVVYGTFLWYAIRT